MESAAAAIPALRGQMNDGDSPIAVHAATTLRSIDPPINIESRLIELLKNSCLEIRQSAARVLQQIGTPTAQEALVDAFIAEQDPGVRQQLARSIAEIDSRLSNENRPATP